MNLTSFVKKVGESKSYPVKEKSHEELSELLETDNYPQIKDANDLLKYKPDLIWAYLKASKAQPHQHIVNFSTMREKIKS